MSSRFTNYLVSLLLLCPNLMSAQTKLDVPNYYTMLIQQELRLDQALSKLDSAILVNMESGHKVNLASLWNQKGNMYSKTSDLNSSYHCYKKALKLYEETANDVGIGNCYMNFARLSEDDEKQLYYYEKALVHFRKTDHISGISKVYNNIGVIYEESEQLDLALHYFQNTLQLAREEDLPLTESACMTNIGSVVLKKKDFEASLQYLDTAEVLFKQHDRWDGYVYNCGKKGEAFNYLNQRDSALFYFREQYEVGKKIGLKTQVLEAIMSLRMFYEEGNEPALGLQYANEALQIKDEISEVSKLEYVDMLSYELNVQEKELQLEHAKHQKEIQRIRMIYWAIVGVLILALALLALFRLQSNIRRKSIIVRQKEALIKANNEKHEQELFFKNKELRQLSNYILQKRDFIEILKKEIDEIKKMNLNAAVVKKMNGVLNILNGQLNLSKDNEILQLNMEEIQKYFLLRLKDQYPNLTHGDIKLLSLLALNMSSKEIAPIVGISVDSVHTKRYRLRKKLNLPSDVNFSQFLQNVE